MRVLEPHHFQQSAVKHKKRAKKRRVRKAFVVLSLILVISGGLFYFADSMLVSTEQSQQDNVNEIYNEDNNEQTLVLRRFTGEEFKALYQSIAHPNTQLISATDLPEITGNPAADKRIRELAESRGYVLSSVPLQPIVKIDEPRLQGDDLLQPLAAQSWLSLKEAATEAEIPLLLTSGYRSLEMQRELFLQRLYANGTNPSFIAAGVGDDAIIQTLTLAAPPGYSRHHTGYTIDLWCDDGSREFVDSVCYEWLSTNNYEIAKLNQWVPSYPEGVALQGPEPEPWEYVWVGNDVLYEKQ